jgi:1,5-anhydro-D-fructose reductase (1,5-anhydro-D-mannitol-forming)
MVRWGILGCGDVTELKSGPALQRAEGSSLVAVMRRSRDKARDYAQRHGVASFYDDAQKLIDDPDVDAVYVATPPGSHLELALRVAAAGKPAYVEKPMARSHGEACQMVEAFARRGVPLFVAYYRRALDRFVRVAELLKTGRIGKPSSVTIHFTGPQQKSYGSWRTEPEQSGGGIFLDLACHTLDLVDFWLGPLDDVHGVADGPGPEDRVAMSFRAGDAVGSALFDYTSDERTDRIEIVGELGRISMATFGGDPIELWTTEGTERVELPNPAHIQQPLVQTVVDALSGRGSCPSTGESAARTSDVMDRVLTEFYGGRSDAFWSRPDTWRRRAI